MKKLKWLLVLIAFIPCVFMFTACKSERVVVGIEKSAESTSIVDVYTIKYSDGTTGSFSVTNGENGDDLNIEEIYNVAKENGYTGTFLEFLEDYLDVEVNSDNTVSAVNKAMQSSVIITCEFPTTSGSFLNSAKDIAVGSGAGVIYKLDKTSGDAYIITNYHVVYNSSSQTQTGISSKIMCYLYGADISRTYKLDSNNQKVYDLNGYPILEYSSGAISCEYVGGSMMQDVAVLKVTGSDVLKNSIAKEVEFVDSDFVQVGSKAIAIGNPEGKGFSTTEGIVSVDSENLTMTAADDQTSATFRVMRIDTAVNSGNSGGGLYNTDGKLIGIVNAKIIDSKIENIGYAIPSNVATKVADNIIRNSASITKKPKKATIGITIKAENSRSVYDEETDTISIVQEIYIDQISENSIADASNLSVGQKIKSITIKGTKYKITRLHQLVDLCWLLEIGDVISFEIEGVASPIMVAVTAESVSDVQ